MEEGGHCACPEWVDECLADVEDMWAYDENVWEKMCADPSYYPCYDCEFFAWDE